eukprot:TRINITY_DN30988_c0_g1_i1.p1 TRINITY_DN30988_c0_g1~~TRINITY_DN30988_c0_g1_i1.p1  ORF type:complete len:633 (+),score=194.20 TRINITY_DN30988_c0_g1_i1:82-1899(+)
MASGCDGRKSPESLLCPPGVPAVSSFGSGMSASPTSLTSMNSTEIFHSQLDASEINMQMFNMPISNVAKRMAIFDKDKDAQSKRSKEGRSQSDTEDETAAPHPLNATLDQALSVADMTERRERMEDQLRRLSRFVVGTPRSVTQRDSQPLLICMVGLPARGKTYTSRRIMRYLAWLGVKCQVFNVAIYRRKNVGFPKAEYFNFAEETQQGSHPNKLLAVLEQALEDTYKWLANGEGQVAILDGTNHTRKRREIIAKKFQNFLPRERMMFIEMGDICGGASESISAKSVVSMPEYKGSDPTEAVRDFKLRLENYANSYETVSAAEGVPFIKYSSTKMSVHNSTGYLAGRLTFLLMNVKVMHRNVFLSLTGEDEQLELSVHSTADDPEVRTPPVTCARSSSAPSFVKQSSGLGDSNGPRNPLVDSANLRNALEGMMVTEEKMREREALEPQGDRFARALVGMLTSSVPKGEPVTVWSCQDPAGTATVKYLQAKGYNTVFWRYLGEFGFSVAQKVMGETYEDIIERLEPIIFEIERCDTHLLIVGHPRVMNALYGYLSERGIGALNPRTVVRVQPRAYDLDCQTFVLQNGELVKENVLTSPDESSQEH